MRVLVTGGAGFIGSHLVDELIARGDSVTVFDNFSVGRREFLASHAGNDRLSIVEGDLLEQNAIDAAMPGHDLVFHLAANPDARRGNEQTDLDLKLETIATYHVLDAMRKAGLDRVVLSSSGTIYGVVPVRPIPEDYGPALPASLYGAGKLASEGLVSAYCHTFGLQGWIFRFANVVGGRATHGVMFDFIRKLRRDPATLEILGDGRQEKPYLSVDDCVAGMLFGIERSTDPVNLFNLGPSTSTSVATIASCVVEAMDLHDVAFHFTGTAGGWPGDVPQYRVDASKIRALGWQPRWSSDEAVHRAIELMVEEVDR